MGREGWGRTEVQRWVRARKAFLVWKTTFTLKTISKIFIDGLTFTFHVSMFDSDRLQICTGSTGGKAESNPD